MRGLWLSEIARKQGESYVHLKTGFGRYTKEITEGLIEDGLHFSVADWNCKDLVEFRTQNKKIVYHVYGVNRELNDCGRYNFNHLLQTIKPRVLVTAGDGWAVDYLYKIPKNEARIMLAPIDSLGYPEDWRKNLLKCDSVVCLTEFGKNELQKVGVESTVIPVGVDTNVFTPLTKASKDNIKKMAGYEGKFIFGTCRRNQPRSHYPIIFKAFKQIADKYDDVLLYINANPFDPFGYNLIELGKKLGLEKKICFTDSMLRNEKPDDYSLNFIYNLFDVYINIASEGYGMTSLEAAACGLPIIALDFAASGDILKNKAVLLPPTHFDMCTRLVEQAEPCVDDLVEAMDYLYTNDKLRQGLGNRCIKWSKEMSWGKVSEMWRDEIIRVDEEFYKKKYSDMVAKNSKKKEINRKKIAMLVPTFTQPMCGGGWYFRKIMGGLIKRGGINVLPLVDYTEKEVRMMKKQGINVCLILSEYCVYNADKLNTFIKLLEREGIKYITFWQSIASDSLHDNKINNILKNSCAHIVTTKEGKDRLFDFDIPPNKVNIFPLGFDYVDIKESKKDLRRKYCLPENDIIISSFGFMEQYKQFELLPYTLKHLKNLYGDRVHYLLISHSKQDVKMNKAEHIFNMAMNETETSDSFIRYGVDRKIDTNEVIKLLKCSDICLFPYVGYYSYSSSGAVRNAIVANIPIITADTSWFKDLDNGEVYKIKKTDPYEMSRSINHILFDDELRNNMLENQRKKVKNENYDNIADMYINLIRKLN